MAPFLSIDELGWNTPRRQKDRVCVRRGQRSNPKSQPSFLEFLSSHFISVKSGQRRERESEERIECKFPVERFVWEVEEEKASFLRENFLGQIWIKL